RLQASVVPAATQRACRIDDRVPDLARGTLRAAVQFPVDDDAAADAGADGDVDEVPYALPGAERQLAEGGGVGVVLQPGADARALVHDLRQRDVAPAFELRRCGNNAVLGIDPTRRTDADPREIADANLHLARRAF